MSESPHSLLPEGLGARVEAETGARIATVRPRGGGGASREGAELTLDWPDGRRLECYMNYDVNKAGAGDDAAFLKEAAILRELSGPLADSGVRTAPFVTAIPELRALVTGRVAGESRFVLAGDADAQMAVARDFMAQLARLHAIDISRVEGLGAARPLREEALARIARTRGFARRNGNDPLIHLALDWLEENVPAEPERQVIVHGDAGPSNFMFADGEVTALLDWELVHFGDPMADLAMICLRCLFQSFVPLPDAFAAYEEAGGAPVDLGRVRYWRLLFQSGFAGRMSLDDPDAPPPPNLGMNMVYKMVHRKVLAEALAEAMSMDLPPVSLPDAPETPHARSFAIALDDLRDVIVPRLPDQQASVKAKGLARLVKWWRDLDRYGPAFDTAELAEISHALGTPFATVGEARAALADAVAGRRIDRTVALRLVHAQVTRETRIMADAMGSLARTAFLPLA
ncbi:MAG: phosphotransferase family protein [Novosphingobium sp.]|nr:phosphotransferase family protein [Novosphingobium sp.]